TTRTTGFFDHVVPPYPPSSAAQGLSTADTTTEVYPGGPSYGPGPYGLGPRVPMFVISPWSTGGYVCSEVFDHTSVLQFMEQRFGVHEPNISPWRRAVCGDLTSAFDFGRSAPAPDDLPDTSAYEPPDRERHPDYRPTPPAVGAMPAQEPGSRPTRPLPYEPYVDAAVEPDSGKIALTFSPGTAAGAQFYVTSGNRTDAPWTYTTGAGRTLTDRWNSAYSGGSHDLTVHGPNGFLRTFRSPGATAGPEAAARHNATSGNLDLTLTNPGATDAVLTITDTYGGAAQTLTVRPGATVSRTVDLRAGRRWYDVSVTLDGEPGFLRRFAGHVETGAAGVSDPAIVTG
ncbi:phospholipase domain-containing protein, partial [Streptomyces sp. CBG30]|uniref:phospholipase domain-containing protein n=1 Tax=Streptomyces sp. CBG30 TaxID=2838869 RepID=UPI001BEAFA9F